MLIHSWPVFTSPRFPPCALSRPAFRAENGLTSADDPAFNSSWANLYSDPNLQRPWHLVLGNHDYRGDVLAQVRSGQGCCCCGLTGQLLNWPPQRGAALPSFPPQPLSRLLDRRRPSLRVSMRRLATCPAAAAWGSATGAGPHPSRWRGGGATFFFVCVFYFLCVLPFFNHHSAYLRPPLSIPGLDDPTPLAPPGSTLAVMPPSCRAACLLLAPASPFLIFK